MSFEEKLTWVNLFVTLGVVAAYFVVVLTPLGEVPAAEIAYQRPMLIAVGASIVLTIIGAILTAIATAVSSELSGQGTAEDIDRKDERDVDINRRGDLLGYYVASAGVLGVMALTMLESDYFWIANALYLSFVAAALVSGVVKLVLYHRGY
jgi:putative effector of murein hydrolase LrgA (UPF0299 family)